MPVEIVVEELRDNYYLVRGTQDGETVETRFFVEPDVRVDLGLAHVSAEDVVRVTVEYLLQRQRIDDLPTQVEIPNVAAAYDGFEGYLRERLGAAQG